MLLLGCGGGGGNQSDQEPLPFPTPEEPPIGPIDCPVLNDGPPVGLACLHCAAPSARDNAMALASIMRRSCRANVATTILLDGTFGDDLQLVQDVIEETTREGATLHLYVYLSNGPWQRRNLPGGIGTEYSGGEWSWRIQSDPGLQQQFTDNIRNLAPVFQALADSGGVLYLIIGLEDNLTYDGARQTEFLMESTMAQAFPNQDYSAGRNPCCGADESLTDGYFRDSHNIRWSPPNGLSTNDGEDFEIEEIPFYITQAGIAGASFVYWTRDFQGIAPGNVFPDPAIRHYRVPDEEEQEALRDLIN